MMNSIRLRFLCITIFFVYLVGIFTELHYPGLVFSSFVSACIVGIVGVCAYHDR
jgi:hypothetical protein